MKVGILTYHRGPNYGGFLQAWHVREAVRLLGYEAEIINYQNPVLQATERPSLRNLHPATIRHALRTWRKARPFRELVESFSPYPFVNRPDEVPWRDFSTVIVGSDVVWDFETPSFGEDPAFFGAHSSQSDTRFVSYAASCGPANPESPIPDWVRDGIQRFSAISVRDSSTEKLVARAAGIESELVVDPTWLNSDPIPQRSIAPSSPYVLVYGNPLNSQRAELLRSFCREKGWKIVGAASSWKHADVTLNGFDPFQWAELFREASAVVTSTLHGLLYAIKSAKPFLMVTLPAAESKSATVLARTGSESRRVSPDAPFTPALLRLLDPDTCEPAQPNMPWIRASRLFLERSLELPSS